MEADDFARIRDWWEDAIDNLGRPVPRNPGRKHLRMLTDQRDSKIVDLTTVLTAAHYEGVSLPPLGMRAPARCSCGRWFSTVDEGECVHPGLEDHT